MALWLAGIVAGLVAGIAMAMAVMMVMPMRGHGLMYPVKLIAGAVLGQAALRVGMTSDVVGLMIHMTMSAVLGLIFALVAGALGFSGAITLIVAGIVYALIVFAVNWFLTLPIVDRTMHRGISPLMFGMSHVVYGLVLGWLLAVFS